MIARLHRVVRLTARTSGVLFAAAHLSSALRPPVARAGPPLYLGFLVAHGAHFAAVSRYAALTGGRRLFPGGRSMADVGGWPTVVAIYATFGALALIGRRTISFTAPRAQQRVRPGQVAAALIAAMFAGTYLQQGPRTMPRVALAAGIAAAVGANLLRPR